MGLVITPDGVLSVTGTTNRITVSAGLSPVIDISSTFEGLLLKKDGSVALTANWNMGAFTAESKQTATTANTVYDGFLLTNTTTASSGNQMYSPAIHWSSKGWITGAGGSSNLVDFRAYVIPIQASATAGGNWVLESSVSGGAYANQLAYSSTGYLYVPNIVGGTSTTSALTFRTTTGVGTTNADFIFQVGNNGTTEAMRILNSGFIGIGSAAPTNLFVLRASNTTMNTEITGFSHNFSTTVYSRPNSNGAWSYYSGANGGALFVGLAKSSTPSLSFFGVSDETTPTVAPVNFVALKRSSATTAALAATEQGFTFSNGAASFGSGTVLITILGSGNSGHGVTAPTAVIHIKAGTASASSAPLKFTTGTLLTTAEAGAMEFLTDLYYVTTTTGAKRRVIVAGTTGRSAAQTAAVASVATYTLGATDASYEVSANILVTTSSAEAFTVTCAYTDEGNTARTQTMPFVLLAGTTAAAINFANGAVPYEGIPIHIRCKASTAITIATTGTFTGATYNCEGIIKQTA